ncbi:uncharacterized protein SEPMUDRAFT_117008 [Sphaerulina musiva SO2202]|uniref:Uncharacterized protein n=1 Tax=Sphaerulina musiva (strain SO2202) TaxID=692275 RepID=M3BWL2_SPHMS|nr:uncharacterized protein SEPMUDRAFT_117008 [Sphaerulina musiva SO2202]EMF12416.1 hypothetical protein SEPMUDRAFT_117008 [Sphaerulina musiva SO2202]
MRVRRMTVIAFSSPGGNASINDSADMPDAAQSDTPTRPSLNHTGKESGLVKLTACRILPGSHPTA